MPRRLGGLLVQTRTLSRHRVRAAVVAALILLTGAILYMGWHSGDLSRAWSALQSLFESHHTAEVPDAPLVKPAAPAANDDAAWRDWMEHGKALSSGISQVIQKHVPGAKAAAAQTLAAVDDVINGDSHFGGSYGFHQSVAVIGDGGGGGWWGGGGGGCWGPDCGGHHPDCHTTNTCPPPPDCQKTNTCPPPDCHDTNTCPPPPDCHETNTCPPPPDCHETNTCPPPPDCHQTNSCPPPPDCHDTNTCPPPDCHQTGNCNPHPVDESDTIALIGAAILPLLLWVRRRRRREMPAE